MSARLPGAIRPRSRRPKARGGRERGGAVAGERRAAEADRRADHAVEMALLGDVERVAVVGAEGEEGRGLDREERRQRVQVLGDRALADQHGHALADLLQRLFGARGLVVGADAGGE